MKLIFGAVLLFVGLTAVFCEGDSEKETTKTKRGILNYGYGAAGIHGLSYNLPPSAYHSYGYHKHFVPSPYAKFPGIYRNFGVSPAILPHHHHGHQQYALSHGGASVTSYNVNYPRYPVYPAKPVIHVPLHVPAPRPILPTPAFVVPHPKPIIPVAVPEFTNRIPVVINKPLPLPPNYSFIPQYPQVHAIPAPDHVHHPQFFPVPLLPSPQPTINSIPTTISTPAVFSTHNPIPFSGSTFIVNNDDTDQWRPIIVNQAQPTPTVPTFNHIHRPSISLLPPFNADGSPTAAPHSAELEFQAGYENAQYHQNQPEITQLYGAPTAESTYDNGYAQQQQQQYDQQAYSQGHQHQQQQAEQQHHQQQLLLQQQQQHQHELHHQQNLQQQQQQIQVNQGQTAFNGQGYEPASNHGSYSGPSSYDVHLGSHTRNL